MAIGLLNQQVGFSDISATTDEFSLVGGLYGVTAVATWGGGSVTLERLAFDETSWVTALTAISANGYSTVSLPSGTYRVAVATATDVFVDIAQIVSGA